jgi:RNA polymerase sigma factor (sigma-70 family)
MEFEALIKRISSKLKGITYKLNGRFNFMNHDDLYQEALLHLWMDFRNGKLSDKTDSYVLQGCYFHLKNYIRTVQDKAHLDSLDALMNNNEESLNLEQRLPVEDSQVYFERLENKLLAETIQNNGSSPREKYILSLFAQGLTTRQIGQRLGVSHVRVVKLAAVIREKSKKYLDLAKKELPR